LRKIIRVKVVQEYEDSDMTFTKAKTTASQSEVKILKRKSLVARWLKDENYKLYCQWVVED